MTEQLVDNRQILTDSPLLRPVHAANPETPLTPVNSDRSFLMPTPLDIDPQTCAEGGAYNRYIKLPKGLLPGKRADVLADTLSVLEKARLPMHQAAAGWAAVEMALMTSKNDLEERLDVFDRGVACWINAKKLYRKLEQQELSEPTNWSNIPRLSMNVAYAPLQRAIIQGSATPEIREDVFMRCVKVAKENQALGKQAGLEGRAEEKRDYAGFSMENIVLLGYNQRFHESRVAMTSSLRAGDGWYAKTTTHDLVFIDPSQTTIRCALPVEVKTTILPKHIERYSALLIGGRRNLSIEHSSISVADKLDSLEAVALGAGSPQQRYVANELYTRVHGLAENYARSRRISAYGAITVFHRQRKAEVA